MSSDRGARCTIATVMQTSQRVPESRVGKRGQAQKTIAIRVVVAGICTVAIPAIAGPPASGVATTSDAEAQAARRRAQLAAPVLSAAAELSAVKKASDTRPTREWKKLTSKSGKLTVEFPGAPKEHAIASDADGALGTGVAYELVVSPDEVYVAGSAPLKKVDSTIDAALEDALRGAAEQLHGTLNNVVRQVSGPLAIQGRVTLPNGAIIVVQFEIVDAEPVDANGVITLDQTLYGLAAGDRSGSGLADAERFLASFASTIPPVEFATLTAVDDPSFTPAPPPAVFELGRPTIAGSLDVVVVRRYLKRNIEKLRYCYERELHAKPRLSGTLTAELTIAADGRVTASKAGGVDPAVARCVADVIGNIEFPKTDHGGTVKYPFKLRPPPRR
jgi:hypothetical protein